MGRAILRGDTSGALSPVVVANPGNPNQLLATSTSTTQAAPGGRTVIVVRSVDGGTSWLAQRRRSTSTARAQPPFSAGRASLLWITAADGSQPVIFAEARPTAEPDQATCNNDVGGHLGQPLDRRRRHLVEHGARRRSGPERAARS